MGLEGSMPHMTQWHATTRAARLCLRTSPLLVVSFAWLHESEDLMLHPTYFVCDVFVHNRVFFVSYFLVSCGYHLVL